MNQLDRPLAIALGAVLVLVIAAVAVVALRPAPADLDPASPEGVVQRYLQAVLDGDTDTARQLLADPPSECDPGPLPPDESVRVSLQASEIDDDRATVEVLITTSGGEPPFSDYEYTDEATFTLDRSGETWRIDEVPWRFDVCPQRRLP